ncbi:MULTISPECIES: hypothetical protein [Micrococcaceae]|uniref:Uncharacterized protein n=1 Tax=Pseudoglutamicibacter albus TaxID=98671 RepID=A0ABU1YY29_9MICC|nr:MULTISPECIES: hypothetical protein [Micrococcaceae]MDR7293269.1 hypothetical protein [Pseudoglutamicibacter albus]OFT23358.1 hypothetical protein HMPREF3175_04995 [Arthrobacter sp. HMSC08H08]OFT44110.1 hypothetical protein HMPREF3160_01105 [Arthrobacter sp. HMSC06H05]
MNELFIRIFASVSASLDPQVKLETLASDLPSAEREPPDKRTRPAGQARVAARIVHFAAD